MNNRSKKKRSKRVKGPIVQKIDYEKLAAITSNKIPSYKTPNRTSGVVVSSRDPFKAPPPPEKLQPKYTGEMLERELKAQERAKQRSKQVAPAYNKGPIMLIPDDCIKDIGR
jgi:Txe/YoeB family toxin of Txe-Axe toxin-antitoxin module